MERASRRAIAASVIACEGFPDGFGPQVTKPACEGHFVFTNLHVLVGRLAILRTSAHISHTETYAICTFELCMQRHQISQNKQSKNICGTHEGSSFVFVVVVFVCVCCFCFWLVGVAFVFVFCSPNQPT